MRVQRFFVGITVPDYVRQALLRIVEPIRGFHWTDESNFHLTLKFLGEVPSEEIEPIIRVLDSICVRPFLLPVKGLGHFPEKGDPQVVWAGLGAAHPHLFQLQRKLEDQFMKLGVVKATGSSNGVTRASTPEAATFRKR